MNSSPDHCPFLNRTDERCSEHFKLDHLQYAFRYCFGSFVACPVYAELLLERQVRRMKEPVHANASGVVQIHYRGRPAAAAVPAASGR